MNDIKTRLLKTGVIKDNEYLDNYLSIITDSSVQASQTHRTQVHHILPKSYFNYLKIAVDESPENKVTLLYKDHLLAHYYLSLCATDWFQYYAQSAVVCMVNFNLSEVSTILDKLEEYQQIYEQFKQKQAQHLSNSLKGVKKGNGHTGKKYMNNGVICVCVSPEEFDRFLSLGYSFGRLTSSTAKDNLRKCQLGKQKPALQNVPKSDAHKNKLRDVNTKRIYITDGEQEKSFHRDTDISSYIENGWYIGRKPMSAAHRQKLSEAKKGKRLTEEHKAHIAESMKRRYDECLQTEEKCLNQK